jgi:hypothetical protein
LAARTAQHRAEAAEANEREDGPRTRQEARQLVRLISRAAIKVMSNQKQGYGAPTAEKRRKARFLKTKRTPKKYQRSRSWQ